MPSHLPRDEVLEKEDRVNKIKKKLPTQIMHFFTRNWVYTPNFGLKIRIFLRFTPLLKKILNLPPFFNGLRTGLLKFWWICMKYMLKCLLPKCLFLKCLSNWVIFFYHYFIWVLRPVKIISFILSQVNQILPKCLLGAKISIPKISSTKDKLT